MLDTLPALVTFALATSITPGPNNLMLMASGANFGFRRTVPHMMGVAIGFVVLAVVVGIGIAGLFQAEPRAVWGLKIASVIYMVWLAWKIASAAPPQGRQAAGKPISFVQAALFQWVNPKAWAMALTAVSVHAPDRSLASVAVVAAVFGAINLPSVGLWALAGQKMRRWLSVGRRLRAFNIAMAVALIGSLAPVLMV